MAKKFKKSTKTQKYEKKASSFAKEVNNHGDFTYGRQSDYDSIIDTIINRDPFSYDATGDALYENYKNQYTALGQLAMKDTMGQAAAMTGGYGSSYSQMAGQQAFNSYMNQLSEKIPELYQLAQNTYQIEIDNLNNKFSVLSSDRQTQYGEYNDNYQKVADKRDYYSGKADSSYEKDWNEYEFKTNLAYQTARDAVEDKHWEKEYKLKKANSTSGNSSVGGGIYTYVPGNNQTQTQTTTLSAEEYKTVFLNNYSGKDIQQLAKENPQIFMNRGEEGQALATTEALKNGKITVEEAQAIYYHIGQDENAYNLSDSNSSISKYVTRQTTANTFEETDAWKSTKATAQKNYANRVKSELEKGYYPDKDGWSKISVTADENGKITSSDYTARAKAFNKKYKSFGVQIDTDFAFSSDKTYKDKAQERTKNGSIGTYDRITQFYSSYSSAATSVNEYLKSGYSYNGETARKATTELYYECEETLKQLKSDKKAFIEKYGEKAYNQYVENLTSVKDSLETTIEAIDKKRETVSNYRKSYADDESAKNAFDIDLNEETYFKKYSFKNFGEYQNALNKAENAYNNGNCTREQELEYLWLKNYMSRVGYKNKDFYNSYINYINNQIDYFENPDNAEEIEKEIKENPEKYPDSKGRTDVYFRLESKIDELKNEKYRIQKLVSDDKIENIYDYQYKKETKNADFDKYVKEGKTKDKIFSVLEESERLGNAYEKSGKEADREKAADYNIKNNVISLTDNFISAYNFLTDKEKDIYYYYLGKYGKEKAEKYLTDGMESTIGKRLVGKTKEEFENLNGFEKALLNVVSPVISIAGSVSGGASDIYNVITGNGIKSYDDAHIASNVNEIIRSVTEKDIDQKIDSKFWSKIATVGYNATMSSADALLGGYGLGGTGYGITMGMGAGDAYARSALERGADTKQIIFGSLLTGIAEGLFEKFSLDKIIKMSTGGTLKSFAVNTLKSAGIEGSEEFFTEIADQFIDNVVMGAKSQDEIRVRELMQKGYTKAQANQMSAFENFEDAFWAFVTGAVSGGQFGAVTNAVSNISASSQYKEIGKKISSNDSIDAVIKEAKGLDSNSEAYKLAVKLESKLQSGKQVSDKQKGHLVTLSNEQLEKEYTSKAQAVVDEAQVKEATTRLESKMKEKGESSDNATSIAKIVSKSLLGEKLSITERVKLKTNSVANEVLNEMKENENNTDWIDMLNSNIRTATRTEASSINNLYSAYNGTPSARISYENASGEKVNAQFKAIKSYNDDKTIDILLANGDVINSAVAEFGDSSLEEMIDVATAFPTETANAFIKGYDGVQNFYNYATGFEVAYKYGHAGLSLESALSADIYGVTDAQIKLAYNLGVADKMKSVNEAEKEIRNNKQTKRVKGKGELVNPFAEEELTDKQKASVEFAKTLCDIGINVELFRNKVDSKGNITGENGSYNPVTNTISLDIDAGLNNINQTDLDRAILRTASHELTHFIQRWSPKQYENLKTFVLKTLNKYDKQKVDKLAEKEIENHKAQGNKLTYDEAVDEVVANACEMMLKDSNAIKKLASENITLAEKIHKFITDFAEKIKKAFTGVKANSYAATEIERILGNLQELQTIWDNALEDATHNMQNTSAQRVVGVDEYGREIDQDGDLIFSIRETQKMDWNEQLNQVEKKELNGSNALCIGVMNNLTSAGFSNNPFAMNQSDYRKSRRKSAKNKNYSKHGIPLKFFKDIQNHLNNSVMFIDNGDKVTVITDSLMLDTKGQPSYIVAGVWKNQKMRQDTVNQIKSVYPLDDFEKIVNKSAENGQLVIINKNKANNMLSGIGVQPSEREDIINLAKNSLSQNNKNVKHSLRDSEYMSAVEQGDMETAQKMVDEAAKQAGYTIKAYHGTPNGDFTVFRDWQYFTESKEYADVYQNQGASSNGYKLTANNPKTYSVYLKQDKIFDTRNENEKRIFENEFYRQWGNGAPLSEKGLPDWTDGDDFTEFFEENDYDYDAILLDEGATGGFGDEVKSRGISIVVKKSNQIKSADPVVYDDNGEVIPLSERFNEYNNDIRYSLRDDYNDKEHNDTYDKSVKEYFGVTYDWKETGYILTDGSKLDFSGKNMGARGGSRTVDHREINAFAFEEDNEFNLYLQDLEGSEKIVDFLNRGNIRIMPEIAGIELSVKPTEKQFAQLKNFIARNNGEVTLDISGNEGKVTASVSYPKYIKADVVINDIVDYFDKGKIPQSFDNTSFSLRDSEYMSAVENGDTDTAQRLVDEAAKQAGYTTKAYHGTLTKGITEFKKEFIGSRFSYDDVGFFFTDNLSIAKDYATSEFDSDSKGEVISAYIKTSNAFVFDKNYAMKNGYGNVFRDNDCINVWDIYQSALLEEAENHNADSIIVKDGQSMMVVAFEPNQIKSAEPIVYDDNGDVIPLSERFDESKSDIRYSLRDDIGEQIQSVLDNTHDKYNHIYMGNTPQTLVNILGLHKLPMLLTNNHAYSMTVSEKKAKEDGRYKKKTNYHNLGIERIEQLPKKLNKPVMIIKSNTDSNNLDIVIVTDMLDDDNRPVIVAMKPYGKGKFYDVKLDTNLIKSGYGRNNFYDFVDTAVKEKRVLFADKKSSQRLNGKWVQFPNSIESIDYNNSLSQYKQIVNNYYMQNSDENVKQFSLRDLMPIQRSANRILREYHSKADLSTVSEQLKRIYALIENGDNADGAIKTLANNIADNIVEKSERNEDYGYIKEFIQGYGMQVTDEIKSEFESDWQRFFKKNNLRLKLNRNGKFGVDEVYKDLCEEFPACFDGDAQGPAEQLREMSDVLDSLKGGEEISLTHDELQQVTDIIADRIKAEYPEYKKADETYIDENDMSNRGILGRTLMSAAKNPYERNKLEAYRRNTKKLNRLEKELKQVGAELKELYFSSGARDTVKINQLKKKSAEISKAINSSERLILDIEATQPIKDLLKREKKKVRQETERKLKAAQSQKETEIKAGYEQKIKEQKEKTKKRVEGRKITELKTKIRKALSDIDSMAKSNTKSKHIPLGMEQIVADLNEAIDRSYYDYDAMIDSINERIYNPSKRLYDPKTHKKETESKLKEMLKNAEIRRDKAKMALGELNKLYTGLKEESNPNHSIYDENIASAINEVANINKPLYDMSRDELTKVYECIQMVKTVIRNQNKLFKASRGKTLEEKAMAMNDEFEAMGIKERRHFADFLDKARNGAKSFNYSLLKPAYLFDMLGENAYDIYKGLRDGQNVFANDLYEAKERFQKIARENNYFRWNNPKKFYEVKLQSGETLNLNIEELMMIYIASKREQYIDHLTKGGIVIERTQFKQSDKKLKGIKGKAEFTDETPHPLTAEDIGKVTDMLSEEQKRYADAMQSYLANEMGAKGNEVTEQLWGIHKFKDKTYFPIKSSQNFLESSNKEVNAKTIKNSGFAKDTVTGANNPVVISSLTEVWESHIQEMSLFHGFALGVEDANRIFNYNFWSYDELTGESRRTGSIKTSIANAFGQQANKAISSFIIDLNGGVRNNGVGALNNLISKFKKNAVFFSLSVTVQQPSAIGRAMALVDDKYFWKTTLKGRGKKTWEEVKKYAPIAKVKEMGSFDTSVGLTDKEWLTHQELSDYKGIVGKAKGLIKNRDDFFSFTAQKADEITWCHIWNAVKAETKAKYPALSGEQLLKKAGQRFEEVIDKTQVYDSVFARAEMMRKKDFGANAITSFMAEPLTTLNMAVKAGRDFNKTGGKKRFVKTCKALVYSAVLNTLLQSLVTASRGQGDDDDETWVEGYLGEFIQNMLDYINPLTYIPLLRDISSLIQGYDVERPDMSIISDLVDAFDVLFDDEKSIGEKISTFSNAVGAFMGLPVKNFTRDVMAIVNTYFDFTDDISTTKKGTAYAIERGFADSFFGAVAGKFGYEFDDSKYNRLVDAYIDGDKTQSDRLYKEIFNKIKNETGKSDDEIKESIQSKVKGGIKSSYLTDEIAEDKAESLLISYAGLDEKKAKLAIKGWDAYNLDTDGDGIYDKYDEDGDEEEDLYSQYSVLRSEVLEGDAAGIKNEMTELEEIGVKEDSVVSSALSAIKESYLNGKISIDQAIKLYSSFELVKVDGTYTKPSENDIHWKQKEWEYTKENGTGEDVESFSRYSSLDTAIANENRANINSAVDELIKYNFDDDKTYDERVSSIQSACSKKLKEMYLSGDTSKALRTMYYLRDVYGMYSGSGRKWGIDDYIKSWLKGDN